MNNNTNRAVYPLTVAITYNLKDPLSVTEDDAEFDDISTIEAIRKALETVVSRVMLVDLSLGPIEQLIYNRPDIVFNIAEGTNGRGREAQIPAILSFLDIPYTGSDETTMCLTLDKTITKLLAKSSGIRTPKWVTL
ncbi:MAG: hypothetical protein FWG21_03670 [Oscillospiraceae bacterium]|nr:hypothetical protein [Oscillospiraceae bacterium]